MAHYSTVHSRHLSFFFSSLSSFSSLGFSCDCWATFNLSAFDLVSRVKSCLASADFARSSASLPRMSMRVHITLLSFCLADAQLNPLPFLPLLFIQTGFFPAHLSTGHIAFSQTSHGASLPGGNGSLVK